MAGHQPGQHPRRRQGRRGGQDRTAGGLPAGDGRDREGVAAEQRGGGQRGPGPAGGGGRAQEQVKTAGGGHGRGPGGCVLQDEVVGPDGPRERRGHRQGGAPGRGGECETGTGEAAGRGEGGRRTDPAGRNRAVRTLHGVLGPVRPVVQGHARLVQAQGRPDGEQRTAPGPHPGRGGTGQGVSGDGEQGGQSQQFGPGTGAAGAGAGPAGRGSVCGRRREVGALATGGRRGGVAAMAVRRRSGYGEHPGRGGRPGCVPRPGAAHRRSPRWAAAPSSSRNRPAKARSSAYCSARDDGPSPTGSLK